LEKLGQKSPKEELDEQRINKVNNLKREECPKHWRRRNP
jgi:hypothetical protein